MKLEAGKYYRARGGSVHGPLKYDGSTDKFPFNSGMRCWTSTGIWLLDGDDSDLDLLTEVYVSDTPTQEKKARRPLETGDLVAIYAAGTGFKGTVVEVRPLQIVVAHGRGEFPYHPKQLRRIVKKKRREYWVRRWSDSYHGPELVAAMPSDPENWIHVREVK